MGPEGVLVNEPLEPVHHEPVEGSTKRVGFRYHISFLKFNVEKGSDDCEPEVGEEGDESVDQVAHCRVDRGRREEIAEGPSLHVYAALRGLSGDSGPSIIAVHSIKLTPFLSYLGR